MIITKPKVSVIVPIYNGEKFLDKCIESIKSQIVEEIEILLINDGSTDKSGNLCDEYSTKDNRIRVIHKKNEGLASTRNRGIKEARAPFLFFLDCDDWIEKNALKLLLEVQEREGADIVLGEFIVHIKNKIYSNKKKVYTVLDSNKALNLILLDKKITSHVCGNLYNKSLFEKVEFPKNRAYEDYATSYKLFYNAKIIVETGYALYHYLQREKSISHDPNPTNEYQFFLGEKERSNFIIANKEIFPDLEKQLRHNLIIATIRLKRILLLTEKGEMKNEISEIQDFLKQLIALGIKQKSSSKRLKIRAAIYTPNLYRRFLQFTKSKKKTYKLKNI